jgi:hypothetical protein
MLGESSGSHGGEYEDGCLVGCCAVLSGEFIDVSEVLAASTIRAMRHRNVPDDSLCEVVICIRSGKSSVTAYGPTVCSSSTAAGDCKMLLLFSLPVTEMDPQGALPFLGRVFCGIRSFITVFMRSRHRSLS